MPFDAFDERGAGNAMEVEGDGRHVGQFVAFYRRIQFAIFNLQFAFFNLSARQTTSSARCLSPAKGGTSHTAHYGAAVCSLRAVDSTGRSRRMSSSPVSTCMPGLT